ncbi:hypothetical protein Lser_V15G01817 [Lactuca serriola]
MDLNYLFGKLQNYEETKALHKEIMKESSKEKYVDLVYRKEARKTISDLDNSDQAEEPDEDLTDDLVASAALIVKRYEESRANRIRRAQFKGSSLGRRSTSEKRNSEWVDKEGTCKDEGSNVKGLMALVNDSIDGICDADEKDGLMVMLGDNSGRAVTDVGTIESITVKLKNVFYVEGLITRRLQRLDPFNSLVTNIGSCSSFVHDCEEDNHNYDASNEEDNDDEDDDNDNDGIGNEEDNDDDSEASNKEGANEEENTDKD